MGKSGIERTRLAGRLALALRRSRVVALTGPRQCGKTTLARALAAGHGAGAVLQRAGAVLQRAGAVLQRAGAVLHGAYFDLEDPVAAARLAEPVTALGALRGLVVIDEVQRAPHLFPVLRVLADRTPSRARFLLLGSASPELMREASESLAGRVEFVDMAGFMIEEVGGDVLRRLWQRGGFPRSFLARGEAASLTWRGDFIRTFLERDVRNLGINLPAAALRRLWTMIAHYHGQVWNASEIGRSLGEAHTTVKRHVDSLCGALVVRQLQPWFENLGKRQIKSPKVYVRDSGLLHALLGIGSAAALAQHPKIGSSWEGFVIEQVLAVVGERNAYYWATQSGAELDLLVLRGGKRYGVEVKHADAPRLTKSMAIAQHDLGLEQLFVVYPGSEAYALGKNAVALGLPELLRKFR